MNMAATIGAGILGVGVLLFVINVLYSRKRGVIAGANPWEAASLEWATTSPPKSYDFLHLPAGQSRDRLWGDPADTPAAPGLETTRRQVLCATTLGALPDHRFTLA